MIEYQHKEITKLKSPDQFDPSSAPNLRAPFIYVNVGTHWSDQGQSQEFIARDKRIGSRTNATDSLKLIHPLSALCKTSLLLGHKHCSLLYCYDSEDSQTTELWR